MGKFYQKPNGGGFVIDRPGSVLFVPSKEDGSLDYEKAIRNVAKINTVTCTNTRTKTDIADGNSFYKAGDRVTALAGTVAIEFTTIDLPIWGMASGSGVVEKTADTMMEMFDGTVIDETAGTIVIEKAYKTGGHINIIGVDGTTYTKSETATTTGQYSVAVADGTTTITFAAADKGKIVRGEFEYTANTVSYTQGKKAMPYHKLIIATTMSDLSNSEVFDVNVEVSQVSISADTVDALQKDPSATKTLTFDIYAPRAGEEPYKVKMIDQTV